ncbi:MAG: chromosome segregation protein SMC [Thermoplasmata archaeon]|jgi:chromosome segregation protein|nr:chromosome segregation protein SMC [Thermoplasmata archaeon]
MYLKRVKLRNFKSFSGATEIPFQPGFTGVAGPNGMGKSNISDAILFVLGPTSSKALRAERLTHLFFNGGSSKKAATECEVTLVFDNADKLLPVDSAEVEVTRYVKLAPSDADGYYSYFYVNGKRTTQTEIDSILSHGRLSGDGYNLVQQGDVNKVVTMGPVPRRGLLERLAGISQYDEELDRATAKRTDLDSNLERIQTLLGEIKNHLGALESQRLQAIQYKEFQQDKRRTEARLARAGHRIAEQELATCQQQVEAARSEIDRLQASRTQLTTRDQELAQSVEAVDHEIAEAGGAAALKFKEELDAKKIAFARLDQTLSHMSEACDALAQQVEELTAAVKSDETARAKLEGQDKELSKRLVALSTQAEANSKEIQGATAPVGKSQDRLAGARKAQLELERESELQQKSWQEVVQQREAAKASLQAAEQLQAQAEDDLRERSVEVKDLELRIKESGGGGSGIAPTGDLQKELHAVKAREQSLSVEAERLTREVGELNRRYLTLDARLKARSESGGRPNQLAAVDFLLSQRNLGKIAGIKGTVEELAEYDPKYRTALQTAGGNRFQALVVETDQVAEQCIQLLRQEKRGRATFLPLNKMLPGRPHGKSLLVAKGPGAAGFAVDLVHFDESLRAAFGYVFGETVVMEDLARARAQMGGVRLVTLTGDLIEATGAISGGYIDPSNQGRGADSAVELKRLGAELREKSEAEAAARVELTQASDRIRVLAQELSTRSIQDQARQSNRKGLDSDLAAARERLATARSRISSAETEAKRLTSGLAAAEVSAEKLATSIAQLKERISRAQEQYLGQLPEAISTRLRSLQEIAQKTGDERVQVNGELESARASLQALITNLQGRRTELDGAEASLASKKKEITKTQAELLEARSSLDALKTLESKQGDTQKVLADKKRVLEAERLQVTGKLGEVQANFTTRQGLVVQEETRLAQAEAKFHDLEAALREFPEPEPDEKPVALDELKRKIATLTGQLDSMGSVNLRAVEEYDAEKGRLDEFGTEASRLTSEKTELVALVGEIERRKREKLSEVVIQVNTNFKEIYGELSAGGEGEIALENPVDPLAGGLIIKARPVGKTVTRLEQLSGGEKSLASLAFIFSLQRYDPSPLYVFDEVDMSLDGLNAEYVGRLLRHNAERAQFIVISLRKVTLKFAHHLFGVTMRGDGCSRVVGIHLEDIHDVEARDGARAADAPAPNAPLEAR